MDYILFVILSTGEIVLLCPCEREQAQAGKRSGALRMVFPAPLLLPERRNALLHDYQMKYYGVSW